MGIKDLPVDVLEKIMSYTHGEPEYLKIKYNHSETLERIQRRYKIHRTEPYERSKILTISEGEHVRQQAIEYLISRKVPFSVKSVEDILMKEAEELDCLLDDEANDGYDEFKIIVDVSLKIRYNHFTYDEEENEFSGANCNFDSERDYNRTLEFLEDIDFAMCEAVEKIHNEIDELRDKGEILGIDNFRLLLLIWEYVE